MSKLKRILPGRKVRLKQAGFFAVLFLFLVMFLPAQSPQAEGAVPLAAPAEEAPLPLPAATETDTFAAPAALAASPDSADWLDSLVETVHAGFLAGLAEMNGNGNGGTEPESKEADHA